MSLAANEPKGLVAASSRKGASLLSTWALSACNPAALDPKLLKLGQRPSQLIKDLQALKFIICPEGLASPGVEPV